MRTPAVAAIVLVMLVLSLPTDARRPLPTDDISYSNGCVIYIPANTSDMGSRVCVHPTNTSCPVSYGTLTIAGWRNVPCDP